MRPALAAALLMLAVAVSAADPPAKAAMMPAATSPPPLQEAAAPPAKLPSPPPANTTTTAPPTTPPSPCCAALTSAGFTRTPGVPVVIIDASQTGPPTRTKQDATLCTCGAGEVGVVGAGGAPIADWVGPIKLKNRGGTNTQRFNSIRQYAAYLPKKPDNATDAASAPPFVLGLDGDHLIFLGQVNDTGGVKESFGRDLARAMGGLPTTSTSSPYATWSSPRGPLGWVPRTVHVELFLADDGKPPATYPSHYRGLYLASEHISRGEFKLDLPKAKQNDAHTAAIATFMHGEKDPDGTTLAGGVTGKEWQVKWPAKDKLTAAQADSLNGELGAFERALFGPMPAAGGGGAPGNSSTTGWRAHMDGEAFTDWFLQTELTKVAKKSYHSASFMHKPSPASPWVMGPVWAQLQGFGTCCGYNFISQPSGFDGPGRSGGSGISPHGWLFSICREKGRCTPLDGPDGNGYDAGNGLALWFGEAFFRDPAFASGAAARWRALRAGPWSDEAVAGMLAVKKAFLTGGPLERTLARWPALGRPWLGDGSAQAAAVFEGVGNWTAARLAWLDRAFVQAADPTLRAEVYPASYA